MHRVAACRCFNHDVYIFLNFDDFTAAKIETLVSFITYPTKTSRIGYNSISDSSPRWRGWHGVDTIITLETCLCLAPKYQQHTEKNN